MGAGSTTGIATVRHRLQGESGSGVSSLRCFDGSGEAATDLDPNAKRARPRLARRGLQMVLRLLAFNAEAWLAEHLNAYLADPEEYRAITRHLLHLGGQVDYTTKAITVTLDLPDSPRVAHALELLADELNATPASLPGDHRPLTYQLAEA